MKTLCLDAGNSRLKWGLHDGETWLAQGAVETGSEGQLSELLAAMPYRMLACNVAGPVLAARIEALARDWGQPLRWFGSSEALCGVTNGYERPNQLGADRWAALVGALSLHEGPTLVVVAGTATTIDLLDATGRFAGGLILPGLDLMKRSLASNTAGLPEAAGRYRDAPTNTDDAIVSGALHATLGAIERMAVRLHRAAGAEICVMLSGGAAVALAPHLELPHRQVENLVLTGLARATGQVIW